MTGSTNRKGRILLFSGIGITALSLLLLGAVFVDWSEWTKDIKATVFGNTLPVFAVLGVVAGLFLILIGQDANDEG